MADEQLCAATRLTEWDEDPMYHRCLHPADRAHTVHQCRIQPCKATWTDAELEVVGAPGTPLPPLPDSAYPPDAVPLAPPRVWTAGPLQRLRAAIQGALAGGR